PTRNLYRDAIEQLARGSSASELDVASLALDVASQAPEQTADPCVVERSGDPGYYLIAEGRPELEQRIGFKPSLRLRLSRLNRRLGIRGYLGLILFVTLVLMALSLWLLWYPGVSTGWLVW